MKSFILLLLWSATSFVTVKAELWYMFVDDDGNPVPGNSFSPKTVITPYVTPIHYPYFVPNYPPYNVVKPNHYPTPPRSPSPTYQEPDLGISYQQPQMQAVARSPNTQLCRNGEFKCLYLHQCIPAQDECDGYVNCVDGTDEANCSCVSKLDRRKICDDFEDCPNGEDETECGECGPDSYSCSSDIKSECYPKSGKCDYIQDCSNGHDESDCFLLTSSFDGITLNPLVRSTEGVLVENFKNKWYPVCVDESFLSARTACEIELGVKLSADMVAISNEVTTFSGTYLNSVEGGPHGRRTYRFVEKCWDSEAGSTQNHFKRVKCPVVCGTVTKPTNSADSRQMRISGGRKSDQFFHPWIAALYLNGAYQCGGSILNRKWIITAAHCVYYEKKPITRNDYLEVRVGFRRQNSFSPNEKFIRVRRILIHPGYELETFRHDIALLELSEDLIFNRWVKPICLPSKDRIGNGTDVSWMWKPEAGTICFAAGWGGFTMRGPDPVDQLMEVELPIATRDHCVTDNVRITCAGSLSGVFAVCQGDSGGPLACKNERNRDEFFLLGVSISVYNPTSKTQKKNACGEPNTVSAFTSVPFYVVDWIDDAINRTENESDILTRLECPGVTCKSNGRCAIAFDGNVDCLNGEDELKIF